MVERGLNGQNENWFSGGENMFGIERNVIRIKKGDRVSTFGR